MDQPGETDEQLMEQVARGRHDCLGPLVRRYSQGLLTYVWRMIGHRQRAEELFQETFLLVWEKRRLYEYPRPFRSWLFAIATNACRADFRRAVPGQVPLEEFTDAEAMDAGPTPPEVAQSAENARLVLAALAALPSQQRMVAILRLWNNLSYGEIGTIVGCNEGTARSHMAHALAGMRRYLEPRM